MDTLESPQIHTTRNSPIIGKAPKIPVITVAPQKLI
jgi:hypothetical protein